jgi:hypothetical protein
LPDTTPRPGDDGNLTLQAPHRIPPESASARRPAASVLRAHP